jgi:hypothetical protein
MYSGKIAVPPGGGGIRNEQVKFPSLSIKIKSAYMSPCSYGNDINKTNHFEKNCKNVRRKLRCFSSVYSSIQSLKKNIINCAVSHLKPEKSKRQYEKCYSDFETDVTRRM